MHRYLSFAYDAVKGNYARRGMGREQAGTENTENPRADRGEEKKRADIPLMLMISRILKEYN